MCIRDRCYWVIRESWSLFWFPKLWLRTSMTRFSGRCVARHWFDNDTDPRLCFQPCRLLLQFAHRVTTFSHRQASARSQRSCPCHNQYQQVWHWVVKYITSWSPLVRCNWTDSFSSCGNSVPCSVCTAGLQHTWRSCVLPLPHQQVVVAGFSLHHLTIWSYQATDVRSLWPVQSARILCLTT